MRAVTIMEDHNLKDNGALTERMAEKMIALTKESDAPKEQFQRMGFVPAQYI